MSSSRNPCVYMSAATCCYEQHGRCLGCLRALLQSMPLSFFVHHPAASKNLIDRRRHHKHHLGPRKRSQAPPVLAQSVFGRWIRNNAVLTQQVAKQPSARSPSLYSTEVPGWPMKASVQAISNRPSGDAGSARLASWLRSTSGAAAATKAAAWARE